MLHEPLETHATLIAALNLERHFVGFEKSTEYFDIAQKKLDSYKTMPIKQSLMI